MSRLIMKDVQLLANNKAKYAHGTITSSTSSSQSAIHANLSAKESVTLVEKGISTTHYYIKFMPANEADYAKLKRDTNLMIYPYPLDAEVNQYKGNYRDPSLPANVPTYQYASVPVKYVLPNVPYVKLAELFLPHETSLSKRVSIYGADSSTYSVSTNALEDESICFQNNQFFEPVECEEINYGGGSPGSGNGPGAPPGEWRPSGRITMTDDSLGTIGVEGLKVRARRWFTTYTGITDANGYYYVDGTYTRPANYWMDFERYQFSVNDHSGGPRVIDDIKQKGPWNLHLTDYDRFCATIFRAAFHYYYKDIQGLNRPPENSFWATQVKIGAYNYDGDSNALPVRGMILGEFINIYNPNNSSRQTYATTIHELGHMVHWLFANNFQRPWASSYDFYQSNFCESWARGVQWALTRMEYPNYQGGDVIMAGCYTNVVIDLIDENYDTANNGHKDNRDLVSGYTIKQIQDALHGASNATEWKNNLINNYANNTEQYVDALFSAWGF
ncbi:MAG: hypothetical protein EOO90_13695 [Pedobacter sp.]|nr:MAG: hypothetical protein EOO90_13695 [Pedobacter sp.]